MTNQEKCLCNGRISNKESTHSLEMCNSNLPMNQENNIDICQQCESYICKCEVKEFTYPLTNQEMKKRFEEFKVALAQTYPLQHISPHPQYELDILAFIQSEINLALANRNKEIVEMIKKVQSVEPASNGRYNACTELYHLITKDNE